MITMNITFKNFSLLSLSLLLSCSTTQQRSFEHSLKAGQCEEAIKNIPSSISSQFMKQTKHISGSVASYALTGLTYGAEVTVYVVGGVAGVVVICSPFLIAEGSAKGGGQISAECVRLVSDAIISNSSSKELLGKKVYSNTSKWRCPDLTDLSQGLRSVATCYESKNDMVNLLKAKEQIDIIRNQDFQGSCVNDEERDEILKQYKRIIEKLENAKVQGAVLSLRLK